MTLRIVCAAFLALPLVSATREETPVAALRKLLKEQALFQLSGAKLATAKTQSQGSATHCDSVRRRRRNQDMTSCRRRHSSGHHDVDAPWSPWKCNENANRMECNGASGPPPPPRQLHSGSAGAGSIMGYPSTGVKKAAGFWCEVDIPPPEWNLKSCPASGTTLVQVLTYNLFWWNLFNLHHGGERSAGRLILQTEGPEKYDMMGFQECDDVWRVLHDANLHHDEYEALDGGRAIAVAWRKSKWTMLDHDSVDVGEDSRDQYYGKRSAMWVRLKSRQEDKTIFFMNHHGPLKVSQGGECTGSSTALNILKVIGEKALNTDVVILVGDFNAALGSSRIREMEKRLDRVHSGHIFGGVDHIFSNCGERGTGKTLDKGAGYYKSDHQALSATFGI